MKIMAEISSNLEKKKRKIFKYKKVYKIQNRHNQRRIFTFL